MDVYVHKLRAKLAVALPGWGFIHTHFGFGYRFQPEPSHPFHRSGNKSVTDLSRRPARVARLMP